MLTAFPRLRLSELKGTLEITWSNPFIFQMRKLRPPKEDKDLISSPWGVELGLCVEQFDWWYSSALTQWDRTSSQAPSLIERKEPLSHSSDFIHCEDMVSSTFLYRNVLRVETKWSWIPCIWLILNFLFLTNPYGILVPLSRLLWCGIRLSQSIAVSAVFPTYKPLRIPGRKEN